MLSAIGTKTINYIGPVGTGEISYHSSLCTEIQKSGLKVCWGSNADRHD